MQSFEWSFTILIRYATFRDCCLREAASIAYAKTCAPYHTWAVRTAVSAGMYALPTREQLLLRLNESGEFTRVTSMLHILEISLIFMVTNEGFYIL